MWKLFLWISGWLFGVVTHSHSQEGGCWAVGVSHTLEWLTGRVVQSQSWTDIWAHRLRLFTFQRRNISQFVLHGSSHQALLPPRSVSLMGFFFFMFFVCSFNHNILQLWDYFLLPKEILLIITFKCVSIPRPQELGRRRHWGQKRTFWNSQSEGHPQSGK